MTNNPDDPDKLLKVSVVARLLATSPDTVRSWVYSGRLKGFRVGGQLRVRQRDVLAFVRDVEPRPVPDGGMIHVAPGTRAA